MGSFRRAASGPVAVVAAAILVAAVSACTPVPGPQGDGPWTWTEIRVDPIWRSQGLATDPDPARAGLTWYTSQFSLERAGPDGAGQAFIGSLPLDVLLLGKHSHTGDLDARGGLVYLPWENKQLGPSDPPSKAWGVYDEATMEIRGWSRHVLVPGEIADNPWVTVSPDGGWIVSGPYEPLTRLEVFPTPAPPFADLPLSATIALDVPAWEVQGCDFLDDSRLVCASDNTATGKQAFLLELDAPIGSGASTAHVTYLGTLPQAPPLLGEGSCSPSGEVEGIDAQPVAGRGTVVRVLVIDRCTLVVHEYEHVVPEP